MNSEPHRTIPFQRCQHTLTLRHHFQLILLFILFSSWVNPILPQANSQKSVYLGNWKPLQDQKSEIEVEQSIVNLLKKELAAKGYPVERILSESTVSALAGLKDKDGFYVSGQYKRTKSGNLLLYAQVFSTRSGAAIDAYSGGLDLSELSGLDLPPDEIIQKDMDVEQKLAQEVVLGIRLNPAQKERRQNIEKNLVANGLAQNLHIELKEKDVSKSAGQIFELLEDIEVVTATHTKTKVREAPAAVYVVTSRQIQERGYRTLVDALEDLPGFDFQRTYGLFPELVHQRGLVGANQRTLIYVDGVLDNNISEFAALGGSLRFPLANVERIEVISGPASVLYGANAFNGIINIITKDGKSSPGTEVSSTYGSFESNFKNPGFSTNISTRGSVGDKEDAIHYSVGAYFYKTQGPNFGGLSNLQDPNYYSANPTKNLQNSLPYYLQRKACGQECFSNPNIGKAVGYYWSPMYNNSHESTYNITAKFQYKGFRFQTVNWDYFQGQGTAANGIEQIDFKQPGFQSHGSGVQNFVRQYAWLHGIVGPQGFIGSSWNFRTNSVLLGYDHKYSDKLSSTTELVTLNTALLNSSTDMYAKKSTTPAISYNPDLSKLDVAYARPDHAYMLEHRYNYTPNKKLSTMVGFVARQFNSPRGYNTANRFIYNDFAAYLQQTYRPWSSVLLSASYRYDHTNAYGDAGTPRVSAIFTPVKDLTIKMLVGTGFRGPTAQEFYSQTNQRKPNPNLKPEWMYSYEFGIGYRFLKKFYSGVQTYYNRVTNLININQTNDITPSINGKALKGNAWTQYQNLGEAQVFGVEWENRYHLTDNLKLDFNYTYTHSRYINIPSTVTQSNTTAGRPGSNYAFDIYNYYYKSITGNPTTPSSGPMPIIAPNKAFIGFTYYIIQDLSIYAGMNYVDVRRTIATDPVKSVAPYKYVKINIRYNNFLYKGMFLQLYINNATNQQFWDPGYRSAAGYYYPTQLPLVTRNIWITIGYKF